MNLNCVGKFISHNLNILVLVIAIFSIMCFDFLKTNRKILTSRGDIMFIIMSY